MLRIQLCPASELENKHWWAKEAAVFVLVFLLSWFGVSFRLDQMRDEIQRLTTTADDWTNKAKELEPTVAKFKTLDEEIALLNRKIDVLSKITVSRIEKVLPVVVLEQLQTLKPKGVWFHKLIYNADRSVNVLGGTMDSLLISEFLLGMRETMNPDTWTNDVRTQVGYVDLGIRNVMRAAKDPNFTDIEDVLTFEAIAKIKEKQPKPLQSVSVVPPGRSQRKILF
jgi:hypothetical protein